MNISRPIRSALFALAAAVLVLGLAGVLSVASALPRFNPPPPPPPPPSGVNIPAPPAGLPIPIPPFILPNISMPAAPQPRALTGSVTKEHRALLVVSAGLQKYSGRGTNTLEGAGWSAIYDFLQRSGSSLPEAQLSPLYGKVVIFDSSRGKVPATVDAVFGTLRDLATTYETVDLIIHCHGQDGALWFEDGGFRVSDFATAIIQGGRVDVTDENGRVTQHTFYPYPAAARTHLRAVLETACYGSSHKGEWRRAGFVAAAGAIAIHADSWISFPTFLNWWSAGFSFGDAVAAANHADPARATDHAVSIFFPGKDVNSSRETDGNMGVDISSPTVATAIKAPAPVTMPGLPRTRIRR